ncbi:MAG: GxxExxY protein [Planctomycetes bacterium]|jgi:GxxExxY protein|nr:GxxExxY protein [Planctomycetota bacterium]
MSENDLSAIIVDAALKVHRTLGPGLLESVYESALALELRKRGLTVEVQKEIPAFYEGVELGIGFRADLIINGLVLIELKSVETVKDVFKKTTLTYLRLTGLRLGLLMNFNEALLKDGIKRIVNGLPD